jgi:hypothetical protein
MEFLAVGEPLFTKGVIMTTSNTLSNSAPYHPVEPYPVFVDTTTGSIQHFNGSVNTQVGGFAPTFTSSVAFTSGTAVQNTAACYATYYIFIGGATSGTVSVAFGPTSACANTVIPSSAGNATNNHAITVRVPSQWYIKVTTTNSATISSVNVLTEGSF